MLKLSDVKVNILLHRKRLIISLAVIALIVIGLFIGCLVLAKPSASKTKAASSNVGHPELSLAALVANINAEVTQKSPNLKIEAGPDLANTSGFPLARYSFSVIIPYSSQTALTFSDTASTQESDQYTAYQAALPGINNLLEQADFTALSTNAGAYTAFETTQFFQRSDAVCQITSYSLLDIDCASSAALTQIANTAKPLVAAYQAADPTSGAETVAAPQISPSESPGYTVAKIAVYGGNGETLVYLYQQAAGAWQVMNLGWYNDPDQDANIQPNCADFESVLQVRDAFMGEACYDSATRRQSLID